MIDIVIYLSLGLVVGFLGGFAGIGGAPFLVAFLVLFFGMPQLVAQGNVLTMMLGPMSLLGVVSMKKYIRSLWGSITIGVLSYCFFSYFGASAAFYLGERDVSLFFAILLISIAIIQLYPVIIKNSNKNERKEKEIISHWLIFLLGSLTGVIGGLFGIGAGVLMVPVLIGPLNMKKEYARALSLAILIPPVSLGAYIKYNQEINIDWLMVCMLFLGYFIANFFGAKSGTRVSSSFFKVIYAIILLVIAFIYLFVVV